MQFDILACENILGYSFRNKNLLIHAFTHASYTNEHKEYPSNERLEFLGDSILGYIITEYLFNRFSNEQEGVLTAYKQSLVSKKPLSKAILDKKINEFLIVGEGEQGGKRKENLSENLFESIVAAIYLDSDVYNAKKFVFSFLDVDSILKSNENNNNFTDYKSELLKIVQKKKIGTIEYIEIEKSGPPHAPSFTMAVTINGKIIAKGKGRSHKDGEKQAAKSAITILQSEE